MEDSNKNNVEEEYEEEEEEVEIEEEVEEEVEETPSIRSRSTKNILVNVKRRSSDKINNIDINKNNYTKRSSKNTLEDNISIILKNDKILKLLDDKTWENKKQGFIELNNFITQCKINENDIELLFTYIVGKLNNFHESNFNLLKEGIQCIISLCKKLTKTNNANKNYLSVLIKGLYEKITDNKLKNTFFELIDVLQKIYSYKLLLDELFEILKTCEKIFLLKEYALYIKSLIENKIIIKVVNDYIEENVNMKNLINFNIKLSNNGNPQLKKISLEIFCLLYRYIGPDLKFFLGAIKNESTIKLIENEFDRLLQRDKNNEITNTINNVIPEVTENTITLEQEENNIYTLNTNINNNSNMRKDISKDIIPSLLMEINKGSWNDKKEGIDYIHNLINNANNKISINGLNDLFSLINDKLKDSNKNLVKIILDLLSHLIDALGTQIKKVSYLIIDNLLLILSDKTQSLREECIKCVKKWIKYQNFEVFCGYFPELLNNGGYEMRFEILNLLIEYEDSITSNYKPKFFNDILNSLLLCLQDKNKIIRNKAETFIKNFKHIKRDEYMKQIQEFKPSISEYLQNIINKILPEKNKKSKSPTKRRPEFCSSSKTLDNIIKITVRPKKNVLNNSALNINKIKNNDVNNSNIINNNRNKSNEVNNSNVINNYRNKSNEANSYITNVIKPRHRRENSTNLPQKLYRNEKNNLLKTITSTTNNNNFNTILSSSTNTTHKKKNKISVKKLERNEKTNPLFSSDNEYEKYFGKTIKVNNNNNNLIKYESLSLTNKPNKLITYEQGIINPRKRRKYINLNFKKNMNKSLDIEEENNNHNIKNYRSKLGLKKTINPVRLNLSIDKKIKNKKLNISNGNNDIKTITNNENNSVQKIGKIFSHNYKFKKYMKIKRCDNEKNLKYSYESSNIDYLSKVKDISKNIFTSEFNQKFFDTEISNVINCIKLLTTKTKICLNNKKNKKNLETFAKIIENFDIFLKVFKYHLSNNQCLSLIKSIIEFTELIIKYYNKKDMKLTEIEIVLLLNIYSDKLIYNNTKISKDCYNLILELNKTAESDSYFVLILLNAFIDYKNQKIQNKLFEIITKVIQNCDLIYNSDTNIKIIKNLTHIYFDQNINNIEIKVTILDVLKNIYSILGNNEFKKRIISLNSKQKEELLSIIGTENEKKTNEDELTTKGEPSSIMFEAEYDNNSLNNKMMSSEKKMITCIINKINENKQSNDNYEIQHDELSSLDNGSSSNNYINYNIENNKNVKRITISEKKNEPKDKRNNYENIHVTKKKHLGGEMNEIIFNENKKIKNTANNKSRSIKKDGKSNQINVNHPNPKIIKVNINNYNTNNININNYYTNIDSSKILSIKKLDEILNNLNSEDPDKKMLESFVNIHELIYYNFDANKNVIMEKVDVLFETFINLIKKFLERIPSEIVSLKNITNILCLLSSIKDLLASISYYTQKNLINLILEIVMLENLKSYGINNEGMIIWRSFNSIMLRIIDACNPINTIRIFLREIIANKNGKIEYIDYYLRCLLIIIKNIKNIYQNVNIGDMLHEISLLFNNFDKNDGEVFNVVKDFLEEIVKNRKEKIIYDYKGYVNLYREGDGLGGKIIKDLINEILKKININEVINE